MIADHAHEEGRPTATRRDVLGSSMLLAMGLVAPAGIAVARAADAFPIRETRVRANGATFRVIEQGRGPAVLFVHGFPEIADTWRHQMQALAQAGYRSIALDMRGYGDSYAPTDPALYTSHHIVGDLVGVLDALKIDDAVLVAHDWGAEHAQRAILMRPDRFRALVSMVIPITPRGDRSWNDQMIKDGAGGTYYTFDMIDQASDARFLPASRTIPGIYYWLSGSPRDGTGWLPNDPARNMLRPGPVNAPEWIDPRYLRKAIRAFEKTGFRGGLNYYRAEQATFDLTPGLRGARIMQPTLYIYGARDGLATAFHPTPPTLAEMRKDAPGLTGVVRLEDAGHWVQHEARDRVNAELLGFLNGLKSSSGS